MRDVHGGHGNGRGRCRPQARNWQLGRFGSCDQSSGSGVIRQTAALPSSAAVELSTRRPAGATAPTAPETVDTQGQLIVVRVGSTICPAVAVPALPRWAKSGSVYHPAGGLSKSPRRAPFNSQCKDRLHGCQSSLADATAASNSR